MFFVCIIKTKAIYYSASGTGFTGLTKASCGTTKNCMYDTNNRIIMQARLYYVDNGAFSQKGDTIYYVDSNSYNLLNNKGLKLIKMTSFDGILTNADKYEEAKKLIVKENGGSNGKTVTNAGKELLENILEYEYDDILRNDVSTTKGYRLVLEPAFIVINPSFGNTKAGLITSRGKIIEAKRNNITALSRTDEELKYRNRVADVGISARSEEACKTATDDKYVNMTYGCGYNVESLDQYINKTCYKVTLSGNDITCKNYDKNNEETYKETYSSKTCDEGTTELDRKKMSKYGTLQVGLGTIKMYCKETTKVSLPGNILESQLRGSYFAWPTINGKYDMSIKTEMDCDYVDEGGKSNTVGSVADMECTGNYTEYNAEYCREKTNGIDPVCPSNTEEKNGKCHNLTNGTITNPVCPDNTEEIGGKCYKLGSNSGQTNATCPSETELKDGKCYKIESNDGQTNATCNPTKTEESNGKCYNLEAAKSLPDATCPSGTELYNGACYDLTSGATAAPTCPSGTELKNGKCYTLANGSTTSLVCPSGTELYNGKCYTTNYFVTSNSAKCPSGYTEYNGKCYYTTSKTCPSGYTEKSGSCVKDGTAKVCPSGTELKNGKCYTLANGSTATPTCPSGTQKWTNGNCYTVNYFVSSNSAKCPSGYQEYNGKCYLVVAKVQKQIDATPVCENVGTCYTGTYKNENGVYAWCDVGPHKKSGTTSTNFTTEEKKAKNADKRETSVAAYVEKKNGVCQITRSLYSWYVKAASCPTGYSLTNLTGNYACEKTTSTTKTEYDVSYSTCVYGLGGYAQSYYTSTLYYCSCDSSITGSGTTAKNRCRYSCGGYITSKNVYKYKCTYTVTTTDHKAAHCENSWKIHANGHQCYTYDYNSTYNNDYKAGMKYTCSKGSLSGTKCYYSECPSGTTERNGKCLSNTKTAAKTYCDCSGTTDAHCRSGNIGVSKNGGTGTDCPRNCDGVSGWTYYPSGSKKSPTGWCIKTGGSASSTVCSSGYTKVGSTCVKCSSGTPSTVNAGKCLTTAKAKTCPSGYTDVGGTCYHTTAKTCPSGYTERSGKCLSNTNTKAKTYCDCSGTTDAHCRSGNIGVSKNGGTGKDCPRNCDGVSGWTYYPIGTKNKPTGWCIKTGGTALDKVCPSGYTKAGSTCVKCSSGTVSTANPGKCLTTTKEKVCPSGYTKAGSTCVKCSSGTASTANPGKCRLTTKKEKNYCASGTRVQSGSKYICVTCKSNLAIASKKNPGKCILSTTSEKNYCSSGTSIKKDSKYICVTCKTGTASTVNPGKCLTTTKEKDYCSKGTSVQSGTKYICVTCKSGEIVSRVNPGKCILDIEVAKNKCTSGTSLKDGSKYTCVSCKSNETVSTVNVGKCLAEEKAKVCKESTRVLVGGKCYKKVKKTLNLSCPEGYNLDETTCEKIYSIEQVSNDFINDIKKITMSAKLTGGTNKPVDDELVKYYDNVTKTNKKYTREVKFKIKAKTNRYYNRILNTVSNSGTPSSIIYDRKEGVISTSVKDSIYDTKENKLKEYPLTISNIKLGYNESIAKKISDYTCHYTLTDNPTCVCPVGTKNAGMSVEDIYVNVCSKAMEENSCADLKVKLCDYDTEDKYCISVVDGSKKDMKACLNSGKSEDSCKIELGCVDTACMGTCTTTERKLEQVGYKLEKCNGKYCGFKAYCINNSKNTTNSSESCITNELGVSSIKDYLNSSSYNRSKLEKALRACEITICNPSSKVIFRTVSLKEPFLTSTGVKRTPGENWNSEELIELKIKNGRGVSGGKLYQKDPIITIKLTPQDIKKIRANNKSIGYGYSDFDLKCLNNDKTSYCVSKLLHTNELELDIKYSRNCRLNMSSTKEQYDNCYNTEKYTATNICK